MSRASRLSGRRTKVEGRRHVRLGNVDLDLGRIDAGAAIDPVRHRGGPEDDDDDENDLQADPGNGAPIDFRRFDRWRRNASEIEQRKAEGRMHEARLDVGADQYAEPDQVDA